MPKVIPIGYYRELCDQPNEYPSIRDFMNAEPQPNEAKVVAYLKGGVVVGARGGMLTDALDPTDRRALFRSDFTDGKYVWRQDLAHYVEKYHVRLPQDFLDHMESRSWQPPKKEDVDISSLHG